MPGRMGALRLGDLQFADENFPQEIASLPAYTWNDPLPFSAGRMYSGVVHGVLWFLACISPGGKTQLFFEILWGVILLMDLYIPGWGTPAVLFDKKMFYEPEQPYYSGSNHKAQNKILQQHR